MGIRDDRKGSSISGEILLRLWLKDTGPGKLQDQSFLVLVTLLDRRENENWLEAGMEMIYDLLVVGWIVFRARISNRHISE